MTDNQLDAFLKNNMFKHQLRSKLGTELTIKILTSQYFI